MGITRKHATLYTTLSNYIVHCLDVSGTPFFLVVTLFFFTPVLTLLHSPLVHVRIDQL